MIKFSIIISHKEEMHLPRRNATISQKFMDKEECKNSWIRRDAKIHGQEEMQKFIDEESQNFLVTIHNLSPHNVINIKVSSDCDHLLHEESGNSFTNIYRQ
jgi:hypothetical protein